MRLALLLILLAGPVASQDAVIRADLDGNGHAETFRLLVPTDDPQADLEVTGQWQTRLYPGLGWAGASAGTLPRLELAANGSLRLITENMAIGRNRWEQAITIAFRDGAYRVAGYTYTFYDTLDLDSHGFCDVNLLTGRGVLQSGTGPEKTVREWRMRAVPLDDWTMDSMPGVCAPMFDG